MLYFVYNSLSNVVNYYCYLQKQLLQLQFAINKYNVQYIIIYFCFLRILIWNINLFKVLKIISEFI